MKRPAAPTLFPTSPDEGTLWLTWLVRLRWLAIFAQVVTLGFVFNMLDGVEVIAMWGITVVLLAAANALTMSLFNSREEIPASMITGQLMLDVAALTTFFIIGGGPDNPFTFLYLVHIAMAAVMLPPRYAAGLTLVVGLCYGLLFAFHLPLHYERHSLTENVLLRLGQALSFGVTAASVAVFVIGVAMSLRRRKEQLLLAHQRTARTDRLRSVGTLAAGAAHELNTPLSTMGLRLRRVHRRHTDTETVRDIEVIRQQLGRCTSIVQRLLVGAGDPSASDIERRPLAELCKEAVGLWSKGATLEIRLVDEARGLGVELPRIAFQQALINLLENARQAQEQAGVFDALELRVFRDDRGYGVVELSDRGVGLPDDADQVGEPFFTTKPSGTGLGVFVARAVADGAGGGLQYMTKAPRGTTARWWFPEATPLPRRSP